jgi:hypothetical protein
MYKRRKIKSKANNIVFERETDSLRIKIRPFSFREYNIGEQFKFIFSGCFVLFLYSMCLISGLNIITGTIAEYTLNLPLLYLGIFMTILGIYCIIGSYNVYRPKPEYIASLEITPETFTYFSQQNSKKHDVKIEGRTFQIDYVNSNIDEKRARVGGGLYRKGKWGIIRSTNCIIAINDCEYRFGKDFNLTCRDADLIAQEINAFLKHIRQA